MSKAILTKTRLHAGIWEGELTLPESVEVMPEIEVTHLDQLVPGHTVTEDTDRAGVWFVRFAIPAELIGDGVQTFIFSDRTTGDTLTSLTIIAGDGLEDDIRAEIDLLRQELDMLKRAFRRHCLEVGAG